MTTNKNLVHVQIAFRNTEPTDALREFTVDKISNCLQKFIHQDTEATVVLKVEKERQIAEISFHSDGAHFVASEESNDMYTSIDKLVANTTRQLSKHKEKLTQHHR